MNAAAVIVAAGSGERFGKPKQLVMLAGKPLFLHSVHTFESVDFVTEIILVTSIDTSDEMRRILDADGSHPKVRITVGGARRQDSVLSGIGTTTVSDDSIILVHDAARPLMTKQLIERVFDAANTFDAAIAAHTIVDTIKFAEHNIIRSTVPRNDLWAAETPQAARKDLFLQALNYIDENQITVTDESQMLELISQPVHIVENMQPNFKITYPEDLRRAESYLRDAS